MKTAILISAIVVLILLSGCCCACDEDSIIDFLNWLFGGGGATIGGLRDSEGSITYNGGSTSQKVQTIFGTVDNPGLGDEFEGEAILVFNGVERRIDAADDGSTYGDDTAGDGTWAYEGDLVLDPGINTFQILVKDDQGNIVARSTTMTVTATIAAMDIIARLTWDTDLSDVDMHIYDPCDRHTYYRAKTAIPNAELDVDDVDGYGPETFTMESGKSVSGTYTIKVRYYNSHGQTAPTGATVRVTLKGSTAQTFGPRTFTQNMANMDDSSNDWTVTTFSVPGATGSC